MSDPIDRIVYAANDLIDSQRAWRESANAAWEVAGQISIEASRYSRQLTRVRWITGSLPHGEQCRPGDCRCAVSDLRVVLGIDCAVCLRGIHYDDGPMCDRHAHEPTHHYCDNGCLECSRERSA